MHFEHWMWEPMIAGGLGLYAILRAALISGYARDTRIALVERGVETVDRDFRQHMRDFHEHE